MARQPLILLLALAACSNDELNPSAFDAPDGAAILTPADGSPFEEPVGFVASARSGVILPLDLKHLVLLSDDPSAPFLPPRQVATGDERQLGPLAVWGNRAGAVNVYAVDLTRGALVSAPYLLGLDPYPVLPEPTATDPVFVDADGSGDSPTLTDIELRNGYTTTEGWSIEFGGDRWWAVGERSGRQALEVIPGLRYCTDRVELCFTLNGAATEGDRFELSTDVGVAEHYLGGDALAVTRVPAHDLLAVAVWQEESAQGSVVFFDPATEVEIARITLPDAGAQPWRFTASKDGTELFVADAKLPKVYRITLDEVDLSASALETIDLETPVSSLALVDTDAVHRLFLAPTGTGRVDVYDLDAAAWVDVNPLDAAVEGVDLHSPIVGLAASPDPIRVKETTSWGAQLEKPVVVATTFGGDVVLLEGDTGCVAIDPTEGPGLTLLKNESELVPFTDRGAPSDPVMWQDDATLDYVTVNPCGGVARDESWIVTYDQVQGNWEVEGSLSGIQEARATEDARYLSDNGAISFTILAGNLPSSDGDSFRFQVEDATQKINSIPNVNASSGSDAIDLPGAPVIFQMDLGPTGGGWDELIRHSFALVPVPGMDKVIRIRLESWKVEVAWN